MMQAKKNPRKKNVINLPSKIGTAALALLFGLVGRDLQLLLS